MTPIAEWPAEVGGGTVPDQWDWDLIKGARNGSAVGILVMRLSRLAILARLDGTDTESAREGIIRKFQHVPAPLRQMLTDDRGEKRWPNTSTWPNELPSGYYLLTPTVRCKG